MKVIRLHYWNDKRNDSWGSIENKVCDWINYLNDIVDFPIDTTPVTTPPPTPTPAPHGQFSHGVPPEAVHKYWSGLRDWAFNSQHHVVIYVKNFGIEYNPDYPIWFADRLQGSVLGHAAASLNYSFYEAEAYSEPTKIRGPWSKNLVHVKNYYQTKGATGYRRMVNGQDKLAYSLNINARIKLEYGALPIEIIIDPDTGNMGEGQP